MSKYVIELGKDVQIVQSITVTQNGAAYTHTECVANLEELNSDYINEHFGELQDEAYQAGLNDAWETARTLVWDTSISQYETAGANVDSWDNETCNVLRDYSAQEAAELSRKINSIGQHKLDFQSDIDRFVKNANEAITELAKRFAENIKDMYK